MRIGLVIEHFDPRRGGAEGGPANTPSGFSARGHEVHVVTQQIGGAAERLPVVPHCLGTIRSRLGRAAAAEAMLRRLDLDVIHDIGMGWHSHVLQSEDGSRIAQWEHRLKLLPRWLRPWKRRMIDVLPRYRDFRTLMARQFGDPDRMVIAVSKMCAGHYQQYHGVSPGQIRLVYHGVDIERFSPEHARRVPRAAAAAIGHRRRRTGLRVRGARFAPQGAGHGDPRRPAAGRRRQPRPAAGGGREAARPPICRRQAARGPTSLRRPGRRPGAAITGGRRLRPADLLRPVQPERDRRRRPAGCPA